MVKFISPFRFGKNFQKKMNDLSKNWKLFSDESEMLHMKCFKLSEKFHKILKIGSKFHKDENFVDTAYNFKSYEETIAYARTIFNQIVSIQKEIDSLKNKYYESLDNSVYRPQ